MQKFTFKNREFELEIQKDETGKKLSRAVIMDSGLEFPFANYDKAAEFLVSEYGGTQEEALEVLNATQSLEGLEVSGTASVVAPTTGKGKGKGKGKSKEEKDADKKAKADAKAAKDEKEPKAEKAEPVKMTFNLPGGDVTRTVQVKTILPDQAILESEFKVLSSSTDEDTKITTEVHLSIDRYSAKNRTSKLVKVVTEEGKDPVTEVLIEGVSLMDAIYKFGEVAGLTFGQADKYIKIKRGLIPEPTKKAPKTEPVTAETLKGEAKTGETDLVADAVKEEVKTGETDLVSDAVKEEVAPTEEAK